MISNYKKRKGFTLIELLVVVSMIALIIGALTKSMSNAQANARIQKATVEVKDIHQAILAYENYLYMTDPDKQLDNMSDVDADRSSLGFLLGFGETYGKASSSSVPTLFQASLASSGKLLDPWGTPYKVKIEQKSPLRINVPFANLQTGYFYPNFYRLSKEERQ